ncbi:hypothetical protein [Crocosphaera sp. XPORK-15E]|uniref:hypothetical protein n=1 Tax=Crocosphaera sp. XPORK-15E TaxID=3110247 RepID=UPI002B1F1A7A|nr:hypothetical protein [Crocosphaera sp. XPORK-15E]MEA5533262.1 hypothetical protein [Crocosphaera sp. XPORK-15E]
MTIKSKFEQYQTLKKKLNIRYKGYNLAEIIALDIIVHVYGRVDISKISYQQLKSNFQKVPNLKKIKKILSSEKEVLFTLPHYQSHRKDYLELIEIIMSKISGSKLEIINIPNQSKSIERLETLSMIINVMRSTIGFLNLKEIIYFSAKLLFYKRAIEILEEIDPNDIKIKKYIAFNAALNYENLIVAFLKRKEIPTYSLQHAIVDRYFCDQDSPPYDLINIENMTANYLLCWSQATVDQIKNHGIQNTKLLLAGSPKYNQIQISSIKQSFRSGLIFFGGLGDESINLEVLNVIRELLKEQDIKWAIKLHPQHFKSLDYRKIIEQSGIPLVSCDQTLSTLLTEDKFDFTISYNLTTTVYYESMCYGVLSFRYSPDKKASEYGLEDDVFSSAKELDQRIIDFKQMNQKLLITRVQEMLEYTIGLKINSYHKYLSLE